jgi:hypothetical protein
MGGIVILLLGREQGGVTPVVFVADEAFASAPLAYFAFG